MVKGILYFQQIPWSSHCKPRNALSASIWRKQEVSEMLADKYTILISIQDFNKIKGRIPWAKIAEDPGKYVSKRSRPESDHQLREPSHMTESAVNDWLSHWIARQNNKRRGLTLQNPSKGGSNDTHEPRRSQKKGNQRADLDAVPENKNYQEEHPEEGSDEANTSSVANTPRSCGLTSATRRMFLTTLSDDKNYRKLLALLDCADVRFRAIL